MPSDIAMTFPAIVCDELRNSGVTVAETDYAGPLKVPGCFIAMKDEWAGCSIEASIRSVARQSLRRIREHDGPWTVRVRDIEGRPGAIDLAFERA